MGGGGGGGVWCSGTLRLCFVYCVLVLVVCSILVCSAYWLYFVFSIACNCRWCLVLVLVYFASHVHVDKSCVSCLHVF